MLTAPAPERPVSSADAIYDHLTPAERAELDRLLAEEAEAEARAKAEHPSMALREFAEPAFQVVEPGRRFVGNWHVDAICDHLEAVTFDQLRHLIINMPPRFMKSLLVSVFWFCWAWTFRPRSRWLYSSYAETLSIRDSLKCRRIIQSPWYERQWGQWVSLTGDQNEKRRFDNTAQGFRLASSVGGANTGEGGDIVVVDDPHNLADVHSEAKRTSATRWYDQVMSTRLNDPETGHRVIVMQRAHEQDLAGHLLEQGGYHHLCLPNEYDPRHIVTMPLAPWKDPRTTFGELLWPERYGATATASAKTILGAYGYAGQMQQRPAPAAGGIFPRKAWRYWQPPGAHLPPVEVLEPNGEVTRIEPVTLPPLDFRAQSWDMAFKDSDGSDWVVGGDWGRRQGNAYLLDQVRGRWDFVETVRQVQAFAVKHPRSTAKWVEDKANGPAVIATLRQKVPGLIAVEPHGDKVARGRAVSPYQEAGNVFLPHPSLAPWVEDFIEECAVFPNGTYDDQVDQMTQALDRLLSGPVRRPMVASTSYVTP